MGMENDANEQYEEGGERQGQGQNGEFVVKSHDL